MLSAVSQLLHAFKIDLISRLAGHIGSWAADSFAHIGQHPRTTSAASTGS